MARNNDKMKYFNVTLCGLKGQVHPSLANIYTTKDSQKCCTHIRMMTGDFFTYEIKSKQSGGSPHCRCCDTQSIESLSHILTSCSAYTDLRKRIIKEYDEICASTMSNIMFQDIKRDKESLCQFILDATSFNLKSRIHINDPVHMELLKLSRDFCFSVNAERMKSKS